MDFAAGVRASSDYSLVLTNDFSKTYLNHCGAVGLFVAHYILCCVHESLARHPCHAAWRHGSSIWTISELVEKALSGVVTPEPRGCNVSWFTVIDGRNL